MRFFSVSLMVTTLLQACSGSLPVAQTQPSPSRQSRAPASVDPSADPEKQSQRHSDASALTRPTATDEASAPEALDTRDSNNPEADLETLRSLNIARAEEIASKKLKDYPRGNAGTRDLVQDLSDFKKEAQKLGVFPSDTEFESFWTINLKKFTRNEVVMLMKDTPVNQLALTIFAATETDIAAAIDAKDPKTAELRQQGLPTKGDEHVVQVLEKSESKRGLLTVTSVAVGAGLAVVASKVKDIFFFGTGSQLTNTVAEPFIRPIRERLDQIVNTYLAPRLVPWARFVTGEAGRQRRALKAAEVGAVASKGVDRYKHVSMSVPDFVEDHKNFYGEMMAADAKWKGWLSAEFQRARNTGWELIYSQPRWLNEQLNTFSTAINAAKLVQTQTLVPLLLKEGAESAEIERLAELIKIQQDIMVFEDLRSPKIASIEAEVMTIVEHWISDRKIKNESIRAFYDGQLQLVMAENRPAFALASFLDSERYFQEYNLALADLPKLQMWQEQGREMTGIYTELRKHREKIEKFFLKRGIKYDVMARVNERGFPFGGKTRPHDLAPITDAVLDRLDQGKVVKSWTPSIAPTCGTSLQTFLRLKL